MTGRHDAEARRKVAARRSHHRCRRTRALRLEILITRPPLGQAEALEGLRLPKGRPGSTRAPCHSSRVVDPSRTTADNYGENAYPALLTDLHERGLDDRVLVMAFGEFGRTPRINPDAGRDHWPGAACVLFAGGGLKVGQVIGATDSHGAFPVSQPYSPRSVLATLYHTLGIDRQHVFHDQSSRPLPVLPEGEPIKELL